MSEVRPSTTPWAFQVGNILGIPIRVHWTFVLLVVWVGAITANQGNSFLVGVILTLLLFACVACHEVGHAFVARRFGVRTFEIVLYPVGGISRTARIPSGFPELAIALAGPLVNLGLAVLTLPVVIFLGATEASVGLGVEGLALFLLLANFGLFLLNLVPAFPMDGGRIVRAALSLGLPADRANRLAGTIGQSCALMIGLAGILSGEFLLLLIALLVFFGATQEAMSHRRQEVLQGRQVSEAMMTRFERLAPHDPLRRAAQLLLNTAQDEFPVVDAWGRATGVVSRHGVLAGLGRFGPDGAVLEVMNREPLMVEPSDDLGELLTGMQGAPSGPILVTDGDKGLVGMVTADSISRFVAIVSQLSGSAPPPS
ncbi:MAG: site-2 protease family protein [Thermoanaerobaculia bacterium]|nr:site-2 protease family protein [Thermoanaerobaculia bacterium]